MLVSRRVYAFHAVLASFQRRARPPPPARARQPLAQRDSLPLVKLRTLIPRIVITIYLRPRADPRFVITI